MARQRAGDSLHRTRAVRITARGWAALAVGAASVVVAYLGGRGAVLVIAGAVILLVGGGLLVVRIRRPDLEVQRVFSPNIVAAGDTVRAELRLRNRAALASTPLRWNDAIPWPQDAEPHELASIPGGGGPRRIRTAHYELHPTRRGVYPVGPLVIEYEDPFGMVTATHALGAAEPLTVVPAIVDLPDGGPILTDGEGAAQLVQRRVLGRDDDLTTREYRSGDALRRVHWRATARRGELMVRQEEHRSHPEAHLFVDTRQTGYPDAEPGAESWAAASDAFEWVVAATASLGVHLDAAGFSVRIEETASSQIAPIGERWEGGRRVEEFLRSLAAVRLTAPAAGAPAPPSSGPLDGPVFALAADPADESVERMLRRRRAGQVAVAFLVGAEPATTRRLADAGWQVIGVDPWTDVAAAWSAVARTDASRQGAFS